LTLEIGVHDHRSTNRKQGRRRPEGAARAFLKVMEREPDAVRRALAA
jgi:DNA-binding transcriptional regulator YiaG